MSPRPAAFLDRDGAIIDDTGFVRDPATVRLIPGAADAIRRLNDVGWAVVVVTNQSGIARGLLSEEDYRAVARRTEELLAAEGGVARWRASRSRLERRRLLRDPTPCLRERGLIRTGASCDRSAGPRTAELRR